MDVHTERFGSRAAGLGVAALLGAGGLLVGAAPAFAAPAAAPATASSAPAVGHCMSGAILGSEASPTLDGANQVLSTRNGYDPHKTSGSTMGSSGNSGPATGGLRPVDSPSFHFHPWSTYTSHHPGAHGQVMSGAILGSEASPTLDGANQVLSTRNGYDPHKTSGSTMGSSGNSGPAAGGLRPVDSPSFHFHPWSTYTKGCPSAG